MVRPRRARRPGPGRTAAPGAAAACRPAERM